MIKRKTWLTPSDRCGVLWVKTFHLYKGSKRKTSYTGDFLRVSVKSRKPTSKVRCGWRLCGVVIRTTFYVHKRDGLSFKFFENNLTILKKRMTPLGPENSGSIPYSIKRKKFINSFPARIY